MFLYALLLSLLATTMSILSEELAVLISKVFASSKYPKAPPAMQKPGDTITCIPVPGETFRQSVMLEDIPSV